MEANTQPSSQFPPADEQSLTDEEHLLLECCRRSGSSGTLFGIGMLIALPLCALAFLCVVFGNQSGVDRGANIIAFLMAIGMLALTVFGARNMLRTLKIRCRIDDALRGKGGKHVISGRLRAIEKIPDRSGVRYVLDDRVVDVILPYWNEVMSDPESGSAPKTMSARTGSDVQLHVFSIAPAWRPILLRAEYDSTPACYTHADTSYEERITPGAFSGEFKAGVIFVAAVISVPLAMISPILVLFPVAIAACIAIPAPGDWERAHATTKHVINGTIDEVLLFKVPIEDDDEPMQVCCYRVNGNLYRVPGKSPASKPGEQVTIEYLQGKLGKSVLSFQAADRPPIRY